MTENSPSTTSFQRIIVGVDTSPSGMAALQWAVDLARATQGTVTAIHAWHIPAVYIYSDLLVAQDNAERALVDAVKLAEAQDVAITGQFVTGGPAQVLIEASKEADVLVVGSRGLGGFRGLLLGSVSSQVVHHARCSVVVVPPPAEGEPTSGADLKS
jgi:nucleotide-binding universal stress UspA family protein